MKKPLLILSLVLAASIAFAASGRVSVLDPAKGLVESGDLLDLGTIGPGQTVEIVADADSGASSSLKAGASADWDHFEVVEASLPDGWSKKDGLIYERRFSAFVTAAKRAKDGEYFFNVRASDEYEGVDPLVFRVKVRVSRDVISLDATPSAVKTGVGIPAVFELRVRNRGGASDVFLLTVSGLPTAGDYSQKVYVGHGADRVVKFEAGSAEQGEYAIAFKATSLSSQEISDSAKASLVSEASLIQDIKAAANGVVLFPSAQQAIFAALGFLARVFG